MNWSKDLKKVIKGKLRFNEPLFKHTTFRIGGPADIWIEPNDLNDLTKITKIAKEKHLRIFIIGNGSNLLVKDGGYRGIVVKLNAPFFKKIEFDKEKITIGSGLSLNRLVTITKNKDLSGCEFLSGIPGTVGGALVTNAGVGWTSNLRDKRASIADLIEEVDVLTLNGRIKTLKKKNLKFDYRSSDLSKYIVISAKLKLKLKKRSQINKTIEEFIKYRNSTQKIKRANAGCIFKNPVLNKNYLDKNRSTAAKLIDLCDLKGKRVGDVSVSRKHANFIVNQGKAKALDVLRAIKIIQKRVKEKFNIYLEPEIKIIGKN